MMMAPAKDHEAAGPAAWLRHPLTRIALMALAVGLGVFALGVIASVAISGWERGGLSTPGAIAGGLALLVVVGSAWLAHWLTVFTREEPQPRSVRVSVRLVWLSLAIGLAMGLFLSLGSDLLGSDVELSGNGPVAPPIAAVAIAVWLLLVPPLTLRWYRTVDEHAQEAYHRGSTVGLHVFIFAAPAWWMGWRGGFLPEPNTMLLFVAVMIAWCAAWMWRRYR